MQMQWVNIADGKLCILHENIQRLFGISKCHPVLRNRDINSKKDAGVQRFHLKNICYAIKPFTGFCKLLRIILE